MAKRIDRSKRTKAQLIEEVETLEESLKGAPAVDTTTAAALREHTSKTREAVKGLSVEAIVTKGASFGLEVQNTISDLTQQCVQRASELKTLQDAIAIEEEEIKRLYQLDVVSASIKDLLEEHNAKKEQLEREIVAARAAWQEEVANHNKQVQQRNADIIATRNREQQEYDYRTKQERARAEEEFVHKMTIQERDQIEAHALAEKSINSRLAEVAKQEELLAQGRIRIENLDSEIKAKVDQAVAIATNSLKKDLTAQHVLEKKDLETQLKLQEQQNVSLNQANTKLAEEITKLHAQLDAARTEVKEIAKSAVEGASGQQALQKVMEATKENGAGGRQGRS